MGVRCSGRLNVVGFGLGGLIAATLVGALVGETLDVAFAC